MVMSMYMQLMCTLVRPKSVVISRSPTFFFIKSSMRYHFYWVLNWLLVEQLMVNKCGDSEKDCSSDWSLFSPKKHCNLCLFERVNLIKFNEVGVLHANLWLFDYLPQYWHQCWYVMHTNYKVTICLVRILFIVTQFIFNLSITEAILLSENFQRPRDRYINNQTSCCN